MLLIVGAAGRKETLCLTWGLLMLPLAGQHARVKMEPSEGKKGGQVEGNREGEGRTEKRVRKRRNNGGDL